MQATVTFQNIKSEIISNLKKATKEIDVALAWLTDEDLIRLLTQRAKDGISVRIVMSNSKENFKNAHKFKPFIGLKGGLFVANSPFMHNKFCIIDDCIIISGSYNWSYTARNNEENIIVMSIDTQLKEDADLLKKFKVKYQYLCSKCSTSVNHIDTLNSYKVVAVNMGLELSQKDEEEINLRSEFENAVKSSIAKAQAANIAVGSFLLERMQSDGGGVEFVKRILHDEITSADMKSGFKNLEKCMPPRVDLSLEYLASRPQYAKLFSEEEISFCKKLMDKYGL